MADATNEPCWHSTFWTHVVGDMALHLEFCEVDCMVDVDNPVCPMSVKATYMGEDVTDSPAIYYDWARVTVRQELEDTASDTMWTEQHRNAGPALTLYGDDLNFQFGTCPDSCRIIVTATLHDPNNPNLSPQQAEFMMI
ncbi:MAG: hypothetical protein K2H72_08470 [Muribaculaceae bacterium]|nr:hypothetical protein [Muribaculaceae bacterium]